MLVVDASFVVQASATVDGLRRVTRQRPIAPPLLWSEVTSVLHELRWRRAVSEQLADVALRNFRSARIGLRRPTRLYEHAWAIASQLGWAKRLTRYHTKRLAALGHAVTLTKRAA